MTNVALMQGFNGVISIHIPRVGDDVDAEMFAAAVKAFQSTSPVWGMTVQPVYGKRRPEISIHIPRVGDDTIGGVGMLLRRNFNPHPPCGG